jgi:hypothetical protein
MLWFGGDVRWVCFNFYFLFLRLTRETTVPSMFCNLHDVYPTKVGRLVISETTD